MSFVGRECKKSTPSIRGLGLPVSPEYLLHAARAASDPPLSAPDATEYLDLAKSALGHLSGMTAPTPSPVKAIRELWDSSNVATDYPESISPFKPRSVASKEVDITDLPPSPAAAQPSRAFERPVKRRRLCLVKVRSRPTMRVILHQSPPLRVET